MPIDNTPQMVYNISTERHKAEKERKNKNVTERNRKENRTVKRMGGNSRRGEILRKG